MLVQRPGRSPSAAQRIGLLTFAASDCLLPLYCSLERSADNCCSRTARLIWYSCERGCATCTDAFPVMPCERAKLVGDQGPKLPGGKLNVAGDISRGEQVSGDRGKALGLGFATSQFDLVMSSWQYSPAGYSRAISTARESGRTGASPEVSSPGNNIPAINAVAAMVQTSCLVYLVSIIVESTAKTWPDENRRKEEGNREGIVVNHRSGWGFGQERSLRSAGHAYRRGVAVVKGSGSLRDQRGLSQVEGNMSRPVSRME